MIMAPAGRISAMLRLPSPSGVLARCSAAASTPRTSCASKPDGAIIITSRLSFDKEMQDVVAFAEHLARLNPNPEAAIVAAGLCSALNMANDGRPARGAGDRTPKHDRQHLVVRGAGAADGAACQS